jgi:hypothetical protein
LLKAVKDRITAIGAMGAYATARYKPGTFKSAAINFVEVKEKDMSLKPGKVVTDKNENPNPAQAAPDKDYIGTKLPNAPENPATPAGNIGREVNQKR